MRHTSNVTSTLLQMQATTKVKQENRGTQITASSTKSRLFRFYIVIWNNALQEVWLADIEEFAYPECNTVLVVFTYCQPKRKSRDN